jgi:ABC-type uncharacterized transport system permease subunit
VATTLTWHEIGAYAIASVLYLAHLIRLHKSVENAARILLGIGVVLHLADIGVRCYQGVTPVSSTVEAMSFVSFLVAAGFLLASLRYRLAAAGAFAVPASLALLVLARIAPSPPATPQMGSLGQAHILLATLGVAVFAFAAVLAMLYLFQDRQLKRKKFLRVMEKGTPLDTLDRLAHRAVSIGFPVFTLAIVTGALWIARLGLVHHPEALRPEYLFAVGAWIAFAILLIARIGAGWRGRRAAWLTLGGFGGTALVIGAYFLRYVA